MIHLMYYSWCNTALLFININIIARGLSVELFSVINLLVTFHLSFGMAYDFIDCVGDDVDVVSDSEVCIMYYIIIFSAWHMMLMMFSFTHRTSRSFWKFPTVSPTSAWLFTGWEEHCFWMSWTSKSFLWALLRLSIYYLRLYLTCIAAFSDFIFIRLNWLCCKLLPSMITFPLLCAFQTGDWTWLKEFYQRLIDQKWQRKKKSKERWYQKAILSKFLYYR